MLGILPVSQFSSGHTYFVQRMGFQAMPVSQLLRLLTPAACRGFDGNLVLGILPVSQFSSGHTYFVQRMGERLGLPQYAVHATFQFSGTPGKRHRMRERLLWKAVSCCLTSCSKQMVGCRA